MGLGVLHCSMNIYPKVYITIATIKFMRNCISKGWNIILERRMYDEKYEHERAHFVHKCTILL